MKYNVAIIGAGQLGSRHLQGVLKSDLMLKVFVVDPSEASLSLSKQRAKEVNHNFEILYLTDLMDLPKIVDLVIVATNADVRAKVTEMLLSNKEVKNLVLEKVLFQKEKDYQIIGDLVKKLNVKTWVNHPRRSQLFYQELKKELSTDNVINLDAYGQNWGMGCNGLHILDLIEYLSSSKLEKLSFDAIDSDLLKSKRVGNIEFTGIMTGSTENGSRFSVTSVKPLANEAKPLSISISNPNQRIFIQEGGTTFITRSNESNGFTSITQKYPMKFQSELSQNMVTEILETNSSFLPSLEEATFTHLIFIRAVLKFYNQTTNQALETCPIT